MDLVVFVANILITALLAATVFADKWVPLDIQAVSLFSVHAASENVLFAAGVDPGKGSMIYHSTDRGLTWEALKSMGNNLDLAVARTGDKVCVVGTKSYCLTIDKHEDIRIDELEFKTNSRDISAVGSQGFGAVGMFMVPGLNNPGAATSTGENAKKDRPPINGVALHPNLQSKHQGSGAGEWKYYDIGLDINQGYFASHGSFPSETTWYVTSGAWPVQKPSPYITILSGKLNLIPAADKQHVDYQFANLKNIEEDHYAGAISKTTDGGKTWTKVFDSSKKFYLNKIHCFDEMTCVTVGEGSKSTVVMMTVDGGQSWETIMQLSGDYSLHACQMISREEIWVSGGMVVKDYLRKRSITQDESDKTYMGLYYHTTNAGKSWSLKTAEGYAYDLSFYGEQTGYAAVLFRDHASIEKFL